MGINQFLKHSMRISAVVVLMLLLLLSFTSQTVYAEQVRSGIIEQSLGRDFGLLVGDVIDHYYVIQVPAEYQLTPASLPPSGDMDYWLQLLNSDYSLITENTQMRRYRLHFKFQTFYAPLDVRTLTIPALTVGFSADSKTQQVTIPAWNFTMSPLKEIAPRGVATDSVQNAFMKEDLRPNTIATATLQQQIWGLAIALIILITAWLSLNGYLLTFIRSPFQQACHEIKKLRKYQSQQSAFHQALQAVHRAFNRVAGHALFAHQTEDFVTKHPEFSDYKPQIDHFYQLSTEALYSEQTLGTEKDFDALLTLCRQLAGAEKLALKKT